MRDLAKVGKFEKLGAQLNKIIYFRYPTNNQNRY